MTRKPAFISYLVEWRLRRFEESARQPGQRPPGWVAGVVGWLAPRSIIEDIQLIRLRRTVARAASRSPFYRELLARAGVDPRVVFDPHDLAALPFTTVEDLADPERFLCVRSEQVGHIFTTAGTTGEPKRIYFTFRDLERIVNLGAASTVFLGRLGPPLPPRIVAVIALPQGLWIGSHEAQRIVERSGGLALAIGMPPPDHALRLIARFRPNALVTSPSYLAALTRVAEERGLPGSITHIMLGGEVLSAEQEEHFAEFWSATILNGYGMTEIGGGQAVALAGCKPMHLNELHVLPEIVDPRTGEASQRGELVFTTLAREAMPLLRYRSGDIGRWVQCGCGRPFRSIVVEGRVGDMFVAGDINLYGRVIAEAIGQVEGATGRVEILLEKVNHTDHLTLRVERLPGRDVPEERVRGVLLAAYPEMRASLDVGALDLKIETVDALDAMAKSFRIVDKRTL